MEHAHKLKIQTKRLNSGKCQVKFHTDMAGGKSRYGYLLVEPQHTLRDVIFHIVTRSHTSAQQDHLFNVGKRKQLTNLLVFDK